MQAGLAAADTPMPQLLDARGRKRACESVEVGGSSGSSCADGSVAELEVHSSAGSSAAEQSSGSGAAPLEGPRRIAAAATAIVSCDILSLPRRWDADSGVAAQQSSSDAAMEAALLSRRSLGHNRGRGRGAPPQPQPHPGAPPAVGRGGRVPTRAAAARGRVPV